MLVGENIFLREMQIGDELPIYKWENDSENWEFGDTNKPFTKEEVIDFVNTPQNLLLNEQLRLMICLKTTKKAVGCIDLFEFNPQTKQAGVGILIGEKLQRNKGVANEALQQLATYCNDELKLNQLFCNISPNNTRSIRLFEKNNFKFIEERELFNQQVNYYEATF